MQRKTIYHWVHWYSARKAWYRLATKSTELATMSTATSCQIQVVADLSPAGFGNSRVCRQCVPGLRQASTLQPVLSVCTKCCIHYRRFKLGRLNSTQLNSTRLYMHCRVHVHRVFISVTTVTFDRQLAPIFAASGVWTAVSVN